MKEVRLKVVVTAGGRESPGMGFGGTWLCDRKIVVSSRGGGGWMDEEEGEREEADVPELVRQLERGKCRLKCKRSEVRGSRANSRPGDAIQN